MYANTISNTGSTGGLSGRQDTPPVQQTLVSEAINSTNIANGRYADLIDRFCLALERLVGSWPVDPKSSGDPILPANGKAGELFIELSRFHGNNEKLRFLVEKLESVA